MKTKLLLAAILLSLKIVSQPSAAWEWERKSGAASANYWERGQAVCTDVSGYIYVAGEFYGASMTFGSTVLTNAVPGNPKVFLAKYDPIGNILWARSMGGPGYNYVHDIFAKNGKLYITGMFSGTSITFGSTTQTNFEPGTNHYFLAQYSSTGTFMWATNDGPDAVGTGVTADRNGNVFVTGHFFGNDMTIGTDTMYNYNPVTPFSTPHADIFYAKYDSLGSPLWAKKAGGSSTDLGGGIVCDTSGNAYMCGSLSASFSFGGLSAVPGAFVYKMTTAGAPIWAKGASCTGSGDPVSIDLDNANNVYTAGYFNGNINFGGSIFFNSTGGSIDMDAFITKYNAAGTFAWARAIGGNNNDQGNGITVSPIGNVYVSCYVGNAPVLFGSTTYDGSGNSDGVIAKYTTTGAPVWIRGVTGPADEQCHDIAIDKTTGKLYTAGEFLSDTVFFGPNQVYTNAANTDNFFLAKVFECMGTSHSVSQTSCSAITLNGQTYTSTGVYTQTLTNSTGCDSTLTLNLTINIPTATSNRTACDSITIEGQTYTSSGTYTQLLTAGSSCDTMMTLNLTISPPLTPTISVSGATLTASLSGASYQWLDCSTSYNIIPGATNQTFSPIVNGNYAVTVTMGTCTDTSACVAVSNVGIDEYTVFEFSIAPNPADQTAMIKFPFPQNGILKILDLTGREILEMKLEHNLTEYKISKDDLCSGIYLITIQTEQGALRPKKIIFN